MSINQVVISGNLTRDAELRNTGTYSVLSFTVAVNDRVPGNNGTYIDRPNFIDCSIFGKRADALGAYLTKGTKVCVSGKLRFSKWEGKDGMNHHKVSVVVTELEFSKKETKEAPYVADIPF